MKIRILPLLILALLVPSASKAETNWPQPKPGFDFSAFRELGIQEGGRKKPLDSFARETVRIVTGREKFRGFDPVELLLSWLTQPADWERLPLLEASYLPLQKQLGLKVESGRISPEDLVTNQEFQIFAQGVTIAAKEKPELSETESQAAALTQRVQLFRAVSDGSAWTVVSRPHGSWENLAQLSKKYPNLPAMWSGHGSEGKAAAAFQGALSAYHRNDPAEFAEFSRALQDSLRETGAAIGDYPSTDSLRREILLNQFKPFRWAWAGYALAFFLLLFSLWLRGNKLYLVGMGVLLLSFLLHAYGFYLRIRVSGRAPVTNMYETVIWVSFGMVLFSFVFEAIYRARYFAVAASAVATLLLILADSAPGILNPAIHPLVPVLRSNYWLTVHVLTITLSYAAFALALGVGHVSLGYYVFKPSDRAKIERLNFFLYRCLQVGVVLLAAGTLLGGVWANASWGRFWGWDPKEVWALIALLGYLAILHGRYAGWLQGFGLAVGSILAFMLVVMAWYGVNFILGAGLHSYGFSSGGAKTVTCYVILEVAWVAFATLRFKKISIPSKAELPDSKASVIS